MQVKDTVKSTVVQGLSGLKGIVSATNGIDIRVERYVKGIRGDCHTVHGIL